MHEEKYKKYFFIKGLTIFEVIIIVLFIGLLIFLFFPRLHIDRFPAKNITCLSNLKQIRITFQMYASDNSNAYPIPENWCDLIKPYLGTNPEYILRCPAAKEGECNYALNPNCDPNSPPKTVLLFETKGGWNLSGGQELVSTENHTDNSCTVLFNDGKLERIKKEDIPNLNWDVEIKNE